MKRYLNYVIYIDTLNNGTEKAFRLEIDDGRWSGGRNQQIWVPKSICVIGEFNDVGWCRILIPQWFFVKNRYDIHRVRGVQIPSGEPMFVER